METYEDDDDEIKPENNNEKNNHDYDAEVGDLHKSNQNQLLPNQSTTNQKELNQDQKFLKNEISNHIFKEIYRHTENKAARRTS